MPTRCHDAERRRRMPMRRPTMRGREPKRHRKLEKHSPRDPTLYWAISNVCAYILPSLVSISTAFIETNNKPTLKWGTSISTREFVDFSHLPPGARSCRPRGSGGWCRRRCIACTASGCGGTGAPGRTGSPGRARRRGSTESSRAAGGG